MNQKVNPTPVPNPATALKKTTNQKKPLQTLHSPITDYRSTKHKHSTRGNNLWKLLRIGLNRMDDPLLV